GALRPAGRGPRRLAAPCDRGERPSPRRGPGDRHLAVTPAPLRGAALRALPWAQSRRALRRGLTRRGPWPGVTREVPWNRRLSRARAGRFRGTSAGQPEPQPARPRLT